MSALVWNTFTFLEMNWLDRQKQEQCVYLTKTRLCMGLAFLLGNVLLDVQEFGRRKIVFSCERWQREQKTREQSVCVCVRCSVSSWFDSQMAGASYYHWCSPHCIWVLLLVSSAVVVFICEPCFFWCNFFCLLDTLFFQPELDIVFPAYVQGWNDWLWQKGHLPPSSRASDGLSDSCHLPLVMPHSAQLILFLIAFCHGRDVFSSFFKNW